MSQRRVPSSRISMHDAKGGSEGWDHFSEERAQPSQPPEEKDRFFRAALATGYIVKVLKPLLKGLGLVIVTAHGAAKASFAIIKEGVLADGAQGNSVLCLPVHVRAGHFAKSTGYTKFASTNGQAGLMVLVEAKEGLAPSQPVTWDSPAAVYLFAGRSIAITSMNLTPATRSKYAHHRLATYEDLASVLVDFARRVLEDKEGPLGDGSGAIFGKTTISVRDLLPLPTLEQMTAPTGEAHKRAMEAYMAFFGAEGLLAGPVLQALLIAEREDGSRSGRFMLTCKLKSSAVQLRASGHQARVQSGGRGARISIGSGRFARPEPMLVGEVDITVAYTPCLRGCYLMPDFALAQRGVREISGKSPGQVGLGLRPYGGGREATRAWNMFLVDCDRPEEWVYARCHALLGLAAEGKAKGWEAMPPMEELGLAPVTLPVPSAFAELMPKLKSQQQDHGS